MSDDVFEAFGGDDIFDDDEQRQTDGEAQNNRTFIVAVAVLGGLLVCAIGSFMLWALVLNRPAPVMEAPVEVPTEMVAEEVSIATETPEPTPMPTLTPTPMPTETPEPTPTPLLGPTNTPTAEGVALADGEDDGDEADTPSVRRTPTPSPTAQTVARAEEPAATSSGASGSTELAQTGLGEWLLIGLAVFLLATMVLARRLRSA
jgi:hypothetical protein